MQIDLVNDSSTDGGEYIPNNLENMEDNNNSKSDDYDASLSDSEKDEPLKLNKRKSTSTSENDIDNTSISKKQRAWNWTVTESPVNNSGQLPSSNEPSILTFVPNAIVTPPTPTLNKRRIKKRKLSFYQNKAGRKILNSRKSFN